MKRFNPVPRVKSLKHCKNKTMAEGFDLQAMFNALNGLEQRVNALQHENAQLRIEQLQQQRNQNAEHVAVAAPAGLDVFRIPDPIKTIPTFDGNKRQLSAWLSTAERTLNLFRERVAVEVFNVYEQTVINKIEGKARDTICVNGNPSTFEEAAGILRAIYGDRNDMATYQTQLWSLKMEDSLHPYYIKTKEIMQNMKSLAKQKELYRDHWDAISEFLDQECLAAFINGLNKPYFGYAQASKPEDLESAYAFLCKFKSAEMTKKQTQHNLQKPNSKFYSRNDNKETNQQNFSHKNSKHSDRSKITPMEIDPSLRSRQAKVFHHESKEDDSDDVDENEDEADEETETNFQIPSLQTTPT